MNMLKRNKKLIRTKLWQYMLPAALKPAFSMGLPTRDNGIPFDPTRYTAEVEHG